LSKCYGLYEVNTKGTKENKKEKGERMLDCVAPDNPMQGPANCLFSEILAYVGYNSPDRPRGAPDSPVCQLTNG
jgi:hypothetical protein